MGHAGATSTTTSLAVSTTSVPTTSTPANVTLSAVGDTELGNTPQLPSDPTAYLANTRNALAAPIVFGNLEGTMYDGSGGSKCGPGSTECYAFRVPTSFAAAYKATGFTILNSANNHSHDFGNPGVLSTSAALRAAGLVQAGLPGQVPVVHEGSVTVAFVDFAPYTNTNDMLSAPTVAGLIRHARKVADVVVVYMHSGAEGATADHVTRHTEYYVGENRGNPWAFAHEAINDGADLVLASGPHVLRGMEFYRGHLIAYSLGDFDNYYDFGGGGDLALSGILHVTLTSHGSFVRARFTSLLLTPAGQAHVDPTGQAAAFVNRLSVEDFGAAAARIGAGGAIAPPS
jgi:poly-gamma-glutamate capsule biosynthesis protein CapA/YwtB (metallophosphatase superfamily)